VKTGGFRIQPLAFGLCHIRDGFRKLDCVYFAGEAGAAVNGSVP
jgi:hypothetical protein